MKDILSLTSTQLRQAADLQEKIQALKTELEQIIGNSGAVVAPPVAKRGRPRKVASVVQAGEEPKRGPKKGGMSAAGRARIAEAQRKRWAKVHANAKPAVKIEKPARKRKMSAAGRAAIAAAARARWAKAKAAGKTSL